MFHRQYNANNGTAIAEERMAKALFSYEQWGAKAKIDQLSERSSSASQGWRDSTGYTI